MPDKKEIPFYQQLTIKLFCLSLIGVIIYIGQDILVPFAFAMVIAILLLPLVNFLERHKFHPVIAIITGILLALVFFSGVVYFLSSQIASFIHDLPSIKEHLNNHFHTIQQWVTKQFNLSQQQQSVFINNAAVQIKDGGSTLLGTTVLSVTESLLLLVLLPVYIFLMLYYRHLIKKFFIKVFKDEHEERVKEVLQESRSIVQGYMIGLIIEMGIVATINCLGFILLGIQYAIFLGVLAAILNMIPYIGMLIASVICVMITLTNSTNIGDIMGVLAVLLVVQFFDNNLIMPRVVSSKVKINALITILGVLVGGAISGISGMFLSIPAIAILKVICDRVDDLKPWGIILGDEITVKKSKLYMKLEQFEQRLLHPTPLKPPTLE